MGFWGNSYSIPMYFSDFSRPVSFFVLFCFVSPSLLILPYLICKNKVQRKLLGEFGMWKSIYILFSHLSCFLFGSFIRCLWVEIFYLMRMSSFHIVLTHPGQSAHPHKSSNEVEGKYHTYDLPVQCFTLKES